MYSDRNKLNYSNLGELQLLMIARERDIHDIELNKEWYKRYGINFPYQLNSKGELFNCLMGSTISDKQADKLILEQAIRLRKKIRDIS